LLDEASTLLSASPDYETTLTWVARLIVPKVADWCIVDIAEDDGTVRRLEVAHDDPSRQELAQQLRRFPPGPNNAGSLALAVIRTGRSEMHADTPDDLLEQASSSPEHLQLLRELAPCSTMVVPLRARGRVFGALSLFTAESGRRLTRADLALTEELARRCALSVDNARILARERRARDASESLQAITSALSKARTPADVANVIIQQGLPGIGAQAGAVALLDDRTCTLEILASVGYPMEMFEAPRSTPLSGSTPMAEAARTGEPMWREAGTRDATRFADFARANRAYPSGIALPLAVDRRVVGALAFSFTEARAFDEQDRAFTTALAAQCALALERARLYESERDARAAAEAGAVQLEIILRGVADGIVAQGADGALIYANDAAAQLMGYASVEALTNAPAAEWLNRFEVLDDRGRALPLSRLPGRRALATGVEQTSPLRIRIRATGEERWALVSATPVTGNASQAMAITMFRDITEQQRAHDRLSFLAEVSTILGSSLDYEATLTRVAELAVPRLADACVMDVIDPDGRVRRLPMRFAAAVPKELSQGLEAIGPPELNGRGAAAQVLRTGEPIIIPHVSEADLAIGARNESHLRLLLAAQVRSSMLVPLVARGSVLGALTLVTSAQSGRTYDDADIALALELGRRAAQAMDNARLYAAEHEARTEAQQAVRARDKFMSIAAHEFRTPVTRLKAAAQLIVRMSAEGTLDRERVARYAQLIDDQTDHMSRLVTDLLDVARLQSGRIELRQEVLLLPHLIEAVIALFGETSSAEHVVRLNVIGEPPPVLADRARLEQVFANLLDNGFKYSPDGGPIDITVVAAGQGAQIDVRDAGIGLPTGVAETIFEPFGRASNAARRQIEGLGLGLHIAREIVQRHGGRIWATSPGELQGTTFSIWLPSAAAAVAGDRRDTTTDASRRAVFESPQSGVIGSEPVWTS
jgi:PAS domain S-box-containing protein